MARPVDPAPSTARGSRHGHGQRHAGQRYRIPDQWLRTRASGTPFDSSKAAELDTKGPQVSSGRGRVVFSAIPLLHFGLQRAYDYLRRRIFQLFEDRVAMPLKFLLASCVGLLLLLESNETLVAEEHQTPKDPSLPPGVIARLGTSRFWHDGGIGAIAASSDGKLVATAEATGRRGVPLVAGSLEGPLAAKGRPLSVLFRLWDARTGQQLAAAFRSEGPPANLAFSPDNRSIAAAFWGGWLGLYDVLAT
jgi:hypothetical protein